MQREIGFVLTALRVAFAAAFAPTAFEEAVVFAANLGGDADTNAAVAGALAGARFGAESDPPALAGAAAPARAGQRPCHAPSAGVT